MRKANLMTQIFENVSIPFVNDILDIASFLHPCCLDAIWYFLEFANMFSFVIHLHTTLQKLNLFELLDNFCF